MVEIAYDKQSVEIVFPALSIEDFATYARASGDLNPIHWDEPSARKAGLPHIIGQGMFGMAILARALTHIASLRDLRDWKVRFVAPVFVGDVVHFRAEYVSYDQDAGTAELNLAAKTNLGRVVIQGSATAANP
jgi:acyl dehydratase